MSMRNAPVAVTHRLRRPFVAALALLGCCAALIALPAHAADEASAARPAITFPDTDAAKAASQAAAARIAELDAKFAAEEKACMREFFANPCANRARKVYQEEKAKAAHTRQQAELYLRVDADRERRARIAERQEDAAADLAQRQSSAAQKPPAAKPAPAPAAPAAPAGAAPGTTPLTDLGPLPKTPNARAQPAPIVNPLPAREPDDPAQRAENREKFERKQEEARDYAERQRRHSQEAAERRERRRAERELERQRLEGPAPATSAPAAQ